MHTFRDLFVKCVCGMSGQQESIVLINFSKRITKNLRPNFFGGREGIHTAYGSSQARGQIGAAAAGLDHSHSNTGSKPHLGLTLQLVAMQDP